MLVTLWRTIVIISAGGDAPNCGPPVDSEVPVQSYVRMQQNMFANLHLKRRCTAMEAQILNHLCLDKRMGMAELKGYVCVEFLGTKFADFVLGGQNSAYRTMLRDQEKVNLDLARAIMDMVQVASKWAYD
jgi:hypothetical protein